MSAAGSADRGVDRRRFLQVTAAAGLAGTALVLEPVEFAAAAAGGEEVREVTGRLEPGAPDWVYLPIDVPPGVREIAVSYSYDRPVPPPGRAGNALDIGIFDECGHALGGPGFRGCRAVSAPSWRSAAPPRRPATCPGPCAPGAGT